MNVNRGKAATRVADCVAILLRNQPELTDEQAFTAILHAAPELYSEMLAEDGDRPAPMQLAEPPRPSTVRQDEVMAGIDAQAAKFVRGLGLTQEQARTKVLSESPQLYDRYLRAQRANRATPRQFS